MAAGARGTDAARLEAEWARRVRDNREQVERIRHGPERPDFYAPVSAHFIDDPRRTGDAVLDALLELGRPDESWLDIGAGAGRYALPLALRVREVLALDPSQAMLEGLRAGMAEHGIHNVRVLEGRWPDAAGPNLAADVALIAQVGYDVERIGPFLGAMEAAARRLCVAVLMDRSPAAAADGFWPVVHGVQRVLLPALPELVTLLRARGTEPMVRELRRPERRFDSAEETLGYLRRQLWAEEGTDAEARLLAEVERRMAAGWDARSLDDGPSRIGLVTWRPSRLAPTV
ncbi:MAG TPA: class I SAM-dependent methyltransferase [Candidatus Limnocylindria bacterium]